MFAVAESPVDWFVWLLLALVLAGRVASAVVLCFPGGDGQPQPGS